MSKGWLGGIFGGDDEEKPDSAASEPLAKAEAFAAGVAVAMAVAGMGSRQEREVARKTANFLAGQLRLVEVQTQHLEKEHAARLHFLHGQAREVRARRLGLWLRVLVQFFIILVAIVIGVVVIRDVSRPRSVIIQPFGSPTRLADEGLTGTAIASEVLDDLTLMQNASRSSSAARDLSNAWSNELKLELPESGISVGELSRVLRIKFRHDVRIDGDVVETPRGHLALTVRGTRMPPMTFSGGPDLAPLAQEAAEYIYSQAQPARWAALLITSGRYEDAISFCQTAFRAADRDQRARLLGDWGIALLSSGRPISEAIALMRASLKLQSDLWVVHADLQGALMVLGDEEDAWRDGEAMRKTAGGRPGRARELDYQNWDALTWNLTASLDDIVADADANGGVGTSQGSAGILIADVQARLHDPDAADLSIKTTKQDQTDPTIIAQTHFVRGLLATETGNPAQAVTEMEAFGIAFANPAVRANLPGYDCWIARAEDLAGYREKADAALKTVTHRYVDCYRFRGDMLDHRGDWDGAKKAYADAVALAPDLPTAYYSWGVALTRHGELAGAEEKLKEANLRGPHWADPLKAWGDVLMKNGNIKDALVEYDAALKYAPNWAALKDAANAAAKAAH